MTAYCFQGFELWFEEVWQILLQSHWVRQAVADDRVITSDRSDEVIASRSGGNGGILGLPYKHSLRYV